MTGAEATLLITTARLEGTADSSCLSLSHRWKHCLSYEWRFTVDRVTSQRWIDTLLEYIDTLTIFHLISLRLNYLPACSISGSEGKF